MLTVYGIRNCDTVKKATRWLDQHAIAYDFHDLRAAPLSSEVLALWLATASRDELINRRSTTWRQLDEQARCIQSDEDAIRLLQAHPTLIKRPVITCKEQLMTIGFKPDIFQETYLNTL